MNSAEVNYTFILENAFGDRTVAKADAIISDVPATIVLTDTAVTVKTGGYFDPYDFILSATAADGSSIIEEVSYNEIDTSVPGDNEVIYELRGQTVSLRVKVAD